MAKNLVLIVDDSAPTRVAFARILERAGFEVKTAPDGEAGLAAARNARPDLILTDSVMPKVDGPELCRRIKADPELRSTLVVVCSASRTSSAEQADGLDAGADGYIAQPISNREFVSRVKSMMRIKQAEDERDRLIAELQDALAQVKALSGIIPICMHCKNIRDDQGYWNRLEQFITEHSEAQFSHGLCPSCAEEHYGDVHEDDE